MALAHSTPPEASVIHGTPRVGVGSQITRRRSPAAATVAREGKAARLVCSYSRGYTSIFLRGGGLAKGSAMVCGPLGVIIYPRVYG